MDAPEHKVEDEEIICGERCERVRPTSSRKLEESGVLHLTSSVEGELGAIRAGECRERLALSYA